jgi:phosphomannomutase
MKGRTLAWPDSVIATHSGLRGPVADLTPELIQRAVEGLSALLDERGLEPSIGVARDERHQGRHLAQDVISMARNAGLDVVDFGIVSTPTAKLAARLRGLGGVIVVTASHLGPEWNGLKLVAGPEYLPVDLRRLPSPTHERSGRLGHVRIDSGAAGDHAEALCQSVDSELLHAAQLRVAWGGGVGSLPGLVLERLGCKTNGTHCDLGVRLDPDGDRLQLADERGESLDPEIVLPLVALARPPHTLVKGADTSRMVDDLVAARKGRVYVVTPGELHLAEGVANTGAELAGEGNGGVLIPAVGMARDALAAAVAILELRAVSGKPLSRLVSELPRYARRRSTVPYSAEREASQSLASLAARLGTAIPHDPEEGICVDPGDSTWGLVRRSATEAVLRVTTEARDPAAADELHEELVAGLLEGASTR